MPGTLEGSIADSANWKQRGPRMAGRAWSPAPGLVRTLHPILEQIEGCAARADPSTAVLASGQLAFGPALAAGWGDLDTARARDQVSGVSALSPGEAS